MTFSKSYDVVVVGAGPAGTGAAAGYARRGAQVLLLEANPRASHRFAGEWIHPTGLEALERLGLAPRVATAKHAPCQGFSVFPDDGSEPILLHYADGKLGFSCEHSELVDELRRRAAAIDGLAYVPHARVTAVEGECVTFSHSGRSHVVRARTIVAADGRSSVVRKSLRPDEHTDVVSHMAGIELRGELPFEGFGHVLLGGPGPILLYRIAEDRIRACIDIPVGAPGARRDARYLWDGFAPRFPASLRPAFREALETQRLAWACNRFLPRTFYGEGNVALVGDAVGFYHPLTASGISIGLKDAEALLAAPSVDAYARSREPQSFVPELLSNALNQVFTREDESAAAIRAAVFEMWRNHPEERERTMRILAGDEVRLEQFRGAFVRVALQAVRDVARTNPKRLVRFSEWTQWPGATAVPEPIRRRMRPASTLHHPLRGLGFRPPRFELPEVPAPTAPAEVDVDALLSRVREEEPAPLSTIARWAGELERALRGRDVAAAEVAMGALVDATPATTGDARAMARALRHAAEVFPGLRARARRDALDALKAELLRRQTERGSFGSLSETAEALEALYACGLPVHHAALRRAFRTLGAAQQADGSWGDARSTAIVARALLATGTPLFDAAERGLASLSTAAELPSEAGEVLRLYRDLRTTRVSPPRRGKKSAGTASEEDFTYCRESLLAVSRSFARPIEMLPGELRTAVTCAYLLCRVADTIEDNAFFSVEERDVRYAAFLRALEADASGDAVREFEELFRGVRGNEVENDLCRHLSVILRVFRTLPEPMQRKTTRWVAEMTRGMQIYSHRAPGDDGFLAVHTVEDLERYCFYVAGTVGHMLTDLFVESFGAAGTSVEYALREQAEAFGIGLQLVNILKDVTDDRERRVSYVPRVSCAKHGVGLEELVDPDVRETAHAIVAPLFDLAQQRLDRALEYVLQIPRDQLPLRLFCLLPLWMAARTLVHARGNDAMFTAGEPVKISRAEVERLIADCMASAADDEQLRARYDELWRTPAQQPTDPLRLN